MNAKCSKLSKLDRFLVNVSFVNRWPTANSVPLPRVLSNHCPILLDTKTSDFGPIPFKNFNSWLSNPELKNIIKGNWGDQLPKFEVSSKIEKFSRKLRHLETAIKAWRSDLVKDLDKQTDSLKQKITAIDLMAEVSNIDDSLISERADLMTKLGDLIFAKVCDLKQEAKARWISDRDENSQFFHGIVNNNLKNSRIHGLNVNGN